MKLRLNGNLVEVDCSDVIGLLRANDIDPDSNGIAVAVNDNVVPRREWTEYVLNEGDQVEVITAMQGG